MPDSTYSSQAPDSPIINRLLGALPKKKKDLRLKSSAGNCCRVAGAGASR